MITLRIRKFPTNSREEIYRYFVGMKTAAPPEVVNSAQTLERREIKKVAALKMVPKRHQSALYEGEGEI